MKKQEMPIPVKLISIIVIVILVAIGIFNSCYYVKTGEVAVVSTFGKITRIDTEGLNFRTSNNAN